MAELVRCARALVGGQEREQYAFTVDDGMISDAGDFPKLRERYRDAPLRSFCEELLVIPGFVNGHSHAYQILLRGWADDMPFDRWRDEALYRVVPQLTAEDVYWVFVAAFSEMLSAGITSVAEFFYLNGEGNERAEAAIRAAGDVGIRLLLARTWMDAANAPAAFRETVEQARERTLELRRCFPNVNICIAPHSLHGASEEMLRAAAEFSVTEACDLHIHVAEAPYEVEMSQERYGMPPILALESLGALGARTVAVHCINIREEEKKLLAQRGARVVHNPMTNLYLGDGITDIVGLQRLGVTIGLGTDADVKPSMFDEMRMAAYLQKLVHRDAAASNAASAFGMGTVTGARALGLRAGDLVAGNVADFVVIDARELSPCANAVNGIVYRGRERWVQAAYVSGKGAYDGHPSPLACEAEARVRSWVARYAPQV